MGTFQSRKHQQFMGLPHHAPTSVALNLHIGKDAMGFQRAAGYRHAMGVLGLVAIAALTSAGCGSQRKPAVTPDGMPTPPLAALLPPAPREAGAPYRIQIGDELDIKFPYQPDLNTHVVVRPDGRVTIPLVGEVEVVGVTPPELERLTVERTSMRLRNPEVSVGVTKLGERRVYVGGEVAKPGFVTLQDEMTPLQAVLQSGGFKKTAKLDSVLLLTPGPGGQYAAARVDMAQVVDEGVPERIRLHPNDVVYVPATWIADMNTVVDQWVRGLIPALPRVGVGYSLSGE